MKLVADDTYQYPEYQRPNWIRGEVYDATDDGETLTIASETGNFHMQGSVRDWALHSFKVDESV